MFFDKRAILVAFERSHDDQTQRLQTLQSLFPRTIMTPSSFPEEFSEPMNNNLEGTTHLTINFNGAEYISNYISEGLHT
jgi:predicted glycosyltransferase